jgi:hypothetical protein
VHQLRLLHLLQHLWRLCSAATLQGLTAMAGQVQWLQASAQARGSLGSTRVGRAQVDRAQVANDENGEG